MEKWSNHERYQRQSELVRSALASEQHSLEVLLKSMREQDEAALYLCGSRLDNEFCFGSRDVGMLLSVLPEDARKAAEPGYHPGSTEVYITFQGELDIEYLDDGVLQTRHVGAPDVAILPPGQCHRIRSEPDRQAASLVVKTNLAHQPGVVRCSDCDKFSNPADCPLHLSWQGEDT